MLQLGATPGQAKTIRFASHYDRQKRGVKRVQPLGIKPTSPRRPRSLHSLRRYALWERQERKWQIVLNTEGAAYLTEHFAHAAVFNSVTMATGYIVKCLSGMVGEDVYEFSKFGGDLQELTLRGRLKDTYAQITRSIRSAFERSESKPDRLKVQYRPEAAKVPWSGQEVNCRLVLLQ